MNEQRYHKILDQNPELTTDGFGVREGHDFQTERAKLYDLYEEFEALFYFIYYATKDTKKFIVKKETDSEIHARIVGIMMSAKYCEGAYIAAALCNLYGIKRSKHSTSCTFTKPKEVLWEE